MEYLSTSTCRSRASYEDRHSLSLFEASTCLTKLAIIRVSSIRNLASMMVFAVGLTIFLTEIEIKISSPLAGTFTYLALNISYLTSFRIHPDKERAAIFDGLKEVKALPRFYQSMTLQKIMQLVRRRIRTQLRLAKDIGINPLSRLLYLEYATRPNGPSSQAQDFVTKLREGLGNSDSDVVNLINNAELLTTEDIKRPISFQLPWEKPINWVQILTIIFGILDAITAIFYLRAFGVFDFIYRTLSGGS